MSLVELQEQLIKEIRKAIKKPIELLTAAKFAAGNYISACNIKGCTAESRCSSCKAWSEVWDDIDAYLRDNEKIGTA